MLEKESCVESVPGETIKRAAAARHLREYANPNHWDSRLATARSAIVTLDRDTEIPLIRSTLEIIEARPTVR